ncbi:hypothetical protein CIK76_11780 [Glutamicibacter sp. BW80]|uniref:hypothetical protein n=1 Tax=unclassified Glutamicibacter TaxID=2627139 RepID=UPI000BB70197|nr:hypothetical protein [Glutamicibacter sp. BW80]PCC28397.1 hypothetical protein CIK76_11780 [Glutamicibacter sp. BW80]
MHIKQNIKTQQNTSLVGTHEHSWISESKHPTSIGYVIYVRCNACGVRRVDIQNQTNLVPTPVSAELHPLPGRASSNVSQRSN